MKQHDLATLQPQLLACACMAVRLAQRLPVQIGHLVGADHHRRRMHLRHSPRLGQRQTPGHCGWRLIGQAGFIHLRHHAIKWQAQPRQQLAPVNGSGRQNQPGLQRRNWMHDADVGNRHCRARPPQTTLPLRQTHRILPTLEAWKNLRNHPHNPTTRAACM